MKVGTHLGLGFVALLMFVLALAACGGPQPTATPQPAATPSTGNGDPADPFQREWDELIAAAQREGRLSVALGAPANVQFAPVFDAFSRQFNIDVSISRGSGNEIVNRIQAERAAGRNEVDVVMAGITSMTTGLVDPGLLGPVEDLFIHPEVLDKSKWFNGQYYYSDAEQRYIFAYAGAADPAPLTIHYNSQMVSEEEIRGLKSAWDLLEPRWRGVMATLAPSGGGSQGSYNRVYFHPDLGPEWIERLFRETDIEFIYDRSVGIDRFIQGQFHLVLGGGLSAEVAQAEEQGLPVRANLPEGMLWDEAIALSFGGAARNIGVLQPAANPNAQKLFTNWFLSREGQTAIQTLVVEGDAPTSLREDITEVGNTRAIDRRQEGFRYLIIEGDPEIAPRLQEAIDFTVGLERELRGQ